MWPAPAMTRTAKRVGKTGAPACAGRTRSSAPQTTLIGMSEPARSPSGRSFCRAPSKNVSTMAASAVRRARGWPAPSPAPQRALPAEELAREEIGEGAAAISASSAPRHSGGAGRCVDLRPEAARREERQRGDAAGSRSAISAAAAPPIECPTRCDAQNAAALEVGKNGRGGDGGASVRNAERAGMPRQVVGDQPARRRRCGRATSSPGAVAQPEAMQEDDRNAAASTLDCEKRPPIALRPAAMTRPRDRRAPARQFTSTICVFPAPCACTRL